MTHFSYAKLRKPRARRSSRLDAGRQFWTYPLAWQYGVDDVNRAGDTSTERRERYDDGDADQRTSYRVLNGRETAFVCQESIDYLFHCRTPHAWSDRMTGATACRLPEPPLLHRIENIRLWPD